MLTEGRPPRDRRGRPTRTLAAGLPALRRSPSEQALFWLLVFQGASGVLGGGMLLAQASGQASWFPDEWLAGIPFDGWLWPGLILGVGLGASALVLAYGVRRAPRWRWLAGVERWSGHHWSWIGSIGLGLGLMAWIVIQRAMIPGGTWLQPFYFMVGAAIAGLALTRGVRDRLRFL